MQIFLELALTVGAGLVGFLGTGLVRRLAPRMGLVQAPNERSSHVTPTPRGGGLAIAVAIVLSAVVLAASGATTLWSIAALTLVIALLGFGDDLLDLPPALRFPIQGLVVALLVWTAAPLAPIPLLGGWALSGWWLAVLLVVVGLWWINLFNFMDGIDGIAASHAILVLVGAGLVWVTSGINVSQPLFVLLACATAATAGFLVLNWPPARIFMGDAGSNSLAVAVYAIALHTSASGEIGYAAWLILPATFVADATVTVLRRTARGERPWQAHRRHAYQQLSRRWGHLRVTLLYSAITGLWCIPLALCAEALPAFSWMLAVIAYVPILGLVIWAQAGAAHETGRPAPLQAQ